MIYDAIIVGGSYAGLSAAMQLARARRQILVVDAGQPRNRFAAHSHGILGYDGVAGADLLATAREQLLRYPSVTMLSDLATSAGKDGDGFRVALRGGAEVQGRRLLLATGVSDQLPQLPGLAERWGKTVLHCPYCHGYEIGGGSIGVLASTPMSVQHASIIADWGDVTLFTDGKIEIDEAARSLLAARKARIEAVPLIGIEGASPQIDALRLADGSAVAVRALFVAAQFKPASPLAQQLGCAFEDTPFGPIVRTDAWKLTSVEGLYAAGDAARMAQNVTLASADGILAGVGAHHSLIAADALAAGAAPPPH